MLVYITVYVIMYLCSRCYSTFFKDFHKGLVNTVKFLLKCERTSEAIFLSPRRGDSLDKFLEEVRANGLQFSIVEKYDAEVWNRHLNFMNGDESWPSYEKDHCYPLMIRITHWKFLLLHFIMYLLNSLWDLRGWVLSRLLLCSLIDKVGVDYILSLCLPQKAELLIMYIPLRRCNCCFPASWSCFKLSFTVPITTKGRKFSVMVYQLNTKACFNDFDEI